MYSIDFKCKTQHKHLIIMIIIINGIYDVLSAHSSDGMDEKIN